MNTPERSRERSGDLRSQSARPHQPASAAISAGRSLCTAALLLILGVGVPGLGCDPSVQAFRPSDDHHYSIYGVLNPAQDTQWVRVEPLPTETSGGAPHDLGATVTLKNLATGQTWALRDSLMEVFQGEVQHNFWTTASIAPGTPYRLVVSNSDGDTTQATTTTPHTRPTFRVVGKIRLPCGEDSTDNLLELRIGNAEELAGLRVRYFQTIVGIHRTYDFEAYDEVTREGDEAYRAFVDYRADLRTTNQTPQRECIADSAHALAYAGGPDWPDWARFNPATLSEVARPDTFSNVEGGLGMFSGVYSSDTASVTVRLR